MKEKVLITGASGFVGYHLIQAALKNGLEVFASVRASSKIEHLKGLPIHFNYTNLFDEKAIERDLQEKRYDYIIHAAGVTKAKNQNEYDYANAELTRKLGLAVVNSGLQLKKFVFISSLAAMGPSNDNELINEQREARPVTQYGKSKLLAEQYLAEIISLPLIVLRPTAVYGPRERDIFIVLKLIAQGVEAYIGRIDQKLSFIHVTDLANITLNALQSNVTGKTYNVSDGKYYDRYALADFAKSFLKKKTLKFHIPKSVVQLIALIQEFVGNVSGTTPALNRNKLAELTASNWACSIESLRKDLSFNPVYDLEKGLAETLTWYSENKWLK
ncbi:NAD-dependent epimerase/dehydratase family protein [Chryseosolibacter indicus]|uniref:NAD(P)-dependent oxidoreductase n=1 Tax=Chryseosolibacter indicus TaxID=2782351 RepID=A0ABS5VST1_9BACT|nr:NAD(P)-dependent oxidoreductase [Chryseosolibacter indicus]MBT1704487.1 NAD(P)-dependent oxidoreductase [Chryseosolibacter indicus]